LKPLAFLRPQLPRPSLAVAALLCAAAATAPRDARADEKEACVAASDQAQTFRDDGKYRQARAALLTCARDVCPGIVRKDCEKWLGDLDSLQPTVVIGARDPKGRDIVDVRVFIDGNKIVDRLNGKPMQVDPGDHIFRYESPGVAVLEEHVVVRVGEKNRFLTAQLKPLTGEISAPAPPPPPPTPPGGEPQPEEAGSTPFVAYTIGGLGVFALGSFTFFGMTGKSDVSDLRGS